MKAKFGFGLVMAMATLPAAAATFDASLGEEAVRVGLEGDLSSVFSSAKGQYDLGALWRSEDGGDAFVPHIGVLLTGDTGARDAKVTAGLGIRGAYIDGENNDGSAIALGGQVDVRIPGFERLALGAYGYFAPEVTTFGDTDKYYDVGLSLGYEVIKDASVYVGWRKVVADLDGGGEIEADDGFNIGLRLDF